MIARTSLLGSCVALLIGVGTDARAEAEASTSPQHFDVLYMADARPVVMRLSIATDGKPLVESWNRFADGMFASLDSDKSGALDAKELSRLNPMVALLTGTNARLQIDRTKPMTRADLGAFLEKSSFGMLRMPPYIPPQQRAQRGFRRGGQPMPEELDKALLELLDKDKDGKLSVAEFTAGIEILSKLDADENEIINTEELLRRPQSPYFFQDFSGNGMMPYESPGVELTSLSPKVNAELARRMLMRYGPKPPNGGAQSQPAQLGFRQPQPVQMEPTVRRLGNNDLKLSKSLFASLDQDGDEELDMDELARFGMSATPEVEMAVKLGKVATGEKPTRVIRAGESPLKVAAGTRDVSIEAPGVRLDVVAPVPTSADAARASFRERYLTRFRTLDRDSNGYIERTDVDNYDPGFGELFTLLDRNGDGKVFEKELETALDEIQDIAASAARGIVTIELNEMGKGIFGLIDSDGDTRLSLRELRAMPKLVERFDSNKDKGLATSEVPRRFEATLAPGLGGNRNTNDFQQFRFGMPTVAPRPATGPQWFQKMDRNREGDVSRREFIGTDEQFRKLDTDGDGLISSDEAEAAAKE